MKTKKVKMIVEASVPVWMTAQQARREVRTLVNEQVNYLSHGPELQDVKVRAISVKPAH